MEGEMNEKPLAFSNVNLIGKSNSSKQASKVTQNMQQPIFNLPPIFFDDAAITDPAILTYAYVKIQGHTNCSDGFDTVRETVLTERFDPEDEPFPRIKQLDSPVETYCVCV